MRRALATIVVAATLAGCSAADAACTPRDFVALEEPTYCSTTAMTPAAAAYLLARQHPDSRFHPEIARPLVEMWDAIAAWLLDPASDERQVRGFVEIAVIYRPSSAMIDARRVLYLARGWPP
jgi:hypothetical protein